MNVMKDSEQKERELDAENKFFFKMEAVKSTELNEVVYAGMNIVKFLEVFRKYKVKSSLSVSV